MTGNIDNDLQEEMTTLLQTKVEMYQRTADLVDQDGDDEERIEPDASRALSEESQLCELAASMVMAILANVLEESCRLRLLKFKGTAGPNFDAVIAQLEVDSKVPRTSKKTERKKEPLDFAVVGDT